MTTEDRLTKLEKQYEDLLLARDVVFTESLRKRLLQNTIFAGITSTDLTDVNETTNVPAGGGSVAHTEAYDKKVRVTIDGTDYWVGIYST